MAQVNVTIGGRSYRIACEDGQEDHLNGLAHQVDLTIADLREQFGEIGDQRLAVMAAITLADRLKEMNQRIEDVRAEVETVQQARGEVAEREAAMEQNLVRIVDSVAERVDALAERLANGAGAPSD